MLIREIHFLEDKVTSHSLIEDVINYFYERDLLISKETYNVKNEIKSIEYIKYNRDGLIEKTTSIDFSKGTPQLNYVLKRKYKKGKLILTTKYNSQKKKEFTINHSYENNIESDSYSYTSNSILSDSITKKTVKKTYEEEKLVSKQELIYKTNNKVDSTSYLHVFSNDNIKEKKVLKNGEIVKFEKYMYYPDGRLQTRSVFDKNNELINYYAYEVRKLIIRFNNTDSYLKTNRDALKKFLK
jgi:hypothetical protein